MVSNLQLATFLRESLAIEGIHRTPTKPERVASQQFLALARKSPGAIIGPIITPDDVLDVQKVYAPGMPLRDQPGMDVSVGGRSAPRGGPAVAQAFADLIARVNFQSNPWEEHVNFEHLHPFMDGNGRTGRILWAWHMLKVGEDPFALSFLHRFYYQTLSRTPPRDV